jgi:hypothetical protein
MALPLPDLPRCQVIERIRILKTIGELLLMFRD